MPERSSPETIIAFDFGLRRIGVAVGQDVTGSASPLGIVRNGENGPDLNRIAALLTEWRPNRLVVGMPLHIDDSPGDLEPTIRDFVAELECFELPIDRVDESHTSQEAAQEQRSLVRSRLKNLEISTQSDSLADAAVELIDRL